MSKELKKIAKIAAKQAAVAAYKSIMGLDKKADDAQTGVDWQHAIVMQNKFMLPPGCVEAGKSQDGKATYYTCNGKWYVVYNQ